MEAQEFSKKSRPFKIAKVDKKFKGIVARNLNELKAKSIKSLRIEANCDNVEITLAEDGTIIDDDDYLNTLGENTKLIIKGFDEETDDIEEDLDVTDGGMEQSGDQNVPSINLLPLSLKNKLSSKNISECVIAFVTMSNEELDFFLDIDLNLLMKELNLDEDVARVHIDNATKELLRRQELSDATQLINLFQKAKEKSDNTKRKRPLNT